SRNLEKIPDPLHRINVFGTDTEQAAEAFDTRSLNWYVVTPTDADITTVWDNSYALINYCNYATKYIPIAEGMTDDEKKVREAEARFFRANAYFHLTMNFGDVHFSLEASEGAVTEANRTPIHTIWDEGIYPDLRFAAENLPPNPSQYGRLSAWAGKFMLGYILLSDSRGTATHWNEAAGLFKDIIENGGFKLMSPFEVFDEDNDGNNTETIFCYRDLPQNLTSGKGGTYNQAHMFYLCNYHNVAGLERSIPYGKAWARYKVTPWLLNQIDETKDCRFEAYFRHTWLCNVAGGLNYTYKLNGVEHTVRREVGDTIFITPKRAWTKEQIDARPHIKVYNPEDVPAIKPSVEGDNIYFQCFRSIYPSIIKYEDTKRPGANDSNGGRDHILLRLANAYLLASEAYLRGGNKSEALKYFNAIRRNAAWSGKEAEMEITEAELDIDMILDERGRELCGEWHRWTDLKRLGKLPERAMLNPLVKSHGTQWDDKFLLRPIPQTHIDRCTNEYPQNPGY
ncbi:MAG: RagB/SusD family nutrient uptake outer membrane protein, partial [Prevotellaceae bacterium]|nr:RagB/SusD family nutrient uptake outer membrane protein [Prevotellaceae bacterium]